MTPSQKLVDAMNAQIGHEMAASQQYLAIAVYFDGETLPELASFFYRQSDEERGHAMKFLHYLAETGARIEIPAVPAPSHDISSAEDAVATSLAQEKGVTEQIYELVAIAEEDRDYAARQMLFWFVTEQLEEENTMGDLLAVIRRAGEDRLLDVEAYVARVGHPEDGAE